MGLTVFCTILFLAISVFFLIFANLVASLTYELKSNWLRILLLKLKVFGLWISHISFVRRRYNIFDKSLKCYKLYVNPSLGVLIEIRD